MDSLAVRLTCAYSSCIWTVHSADGPRLRSVNGANVGRYDTFCSAKFVLIDSLGGMEVSGRLRESLLLVLDENPQLTPQY